MIQQADVHLMILMFGHKQMQVVEWCSQKGEGMRRSVGIFREKRWLLITLQIMATRCKTTGREINVELNGRIISEEVESFVLHVFIEVKRSLLVEVSYSICV